MQGTMSNLCTTTQNMQNVIMCVGFYPRILRVEAPVKYQQVQGGAMRVDTNSASIKFFERNMGRVWMHPTSVCFSAGSYPSGEPPLPC